MKFLCDVEFKIYKTDSKYLPYDVFEVGCKYELYDDFYLIQSENVAFSEEMEKLLDEGKTLEVKAEFWGEYWQDYWGEWDCELELRNEKIKVIELNENQTRVD
jgi:hypothetical protein